MNLAMKILVTGGAGKIGHVAVQQLLEHGHEVLALGRRPKTELEPARVAAIEGAEYQQVDITDYAALRPQLEGMDGVVHLAALTYPGAGPGHQIFQINAGGSFNVYQAAADVGIKRVVSASSINALGFNFGVKPSTIHYLPIDEDHPNVTTDAYSFCKEVLEQIAAYFWRRDGISGVCLRFPYVYVFGERSPWGGRWQARRQLYNARIQQDFEVLGAMPDAERRAHLLKLVAEYDAAREERPHEKPWQERRRGARGMPSPEELPLGAALIGRRTNFWTSLDARDAAQSIEKGLLAEYEGSHPLYVNAAHNSLDLPSALLAAYAFPEVTEFKHPLQGTETLVSIDRARALIGFEPEYQRTM
jgi:nucleoside-diphosphate-sugar epimerase